MNMRIKILGSASGMPTLGKHGACVWINFADKNILLDCGEGTSKQMLRNKLDKNVIDAIAISHYHPDHVIGLFMVLQMLYLQNRKKSITVYLPEKIDEFEKILNYFYTFPLRCTFELNLALTSEINKDYKQITVIPSDHLHNLKNFIDEHKFSNELLSYSFLVNENGKHFLYTSDIWHTDYFKEYLGYLDLLIIDALHPEAREIISVSSNTKARIILTHGISQELEKIIFSSNDNNKFEVADENLEIHI